jgi:hypothetical protein
MQCPLCNATVDEADAKDHYPCDSGGDALRQYTIDRISNSGNAIAHKEGETNIGPLSPDSVGKTVNAQRINGTFAICTDTEFWTEEYVSYIREHNRSSAQSSTKQKNREDTDSEAGTVASSDESKYEGEISTNLGASYDELLDNIDHGGDDDGDDEVPWETSSSRGRYNSTAERSTRSSSSSDSNSTGSSKSKEQDSTKRSNRTASTSSSGPPSRSDLIEEVRAVNDELEHPIRRKDLERKARFNYSQYRDEFGPILDILQAAGIDRREQCINEIHSVVDEINRLPNRADIESESQVSGSFVLRQFDDLLTAHQAYLESEHLDSEGVSDDLLLGEIERLGREQQETRPVMPSDVAEGSVFAPATFTDRFGS